MSLKGRRDPEVVDTVTLQQSTDQYIAVMRDGTIAGENEDAFGITMASGDEGDPVAVCRLGFCPAIGVTASNISDGTELVVAADGKLDALPGSGGGSSFAVAASEENLSTDDAQVGVWVDCLGLGRSRDIPA